MLLNALDEAVILGVVGEVAVSAPHALTNGIVQPCAIKRPILLIAETLLHFAHYMRAVVNQFLQIVVVIAEITGPRDVISPYHRIRIVKKPPDTRIVRKWDIRTRIANPVFGLGFQVDDDW